MMPSFGNTEPMTPEGQAVNPTVWADAYGLWHASVPIGPSAAHLARRLIKAELEARQAAPLGPLRVKRERVTNHGTVIYGEV